MSFKSQQAIKILQIRSVKWQIRSAGRLKITLVSWLVSWLHMSTFYSGLNQKMLWRYFIISTVRNKKWSLYRRKRKKNDCYDCYLNSIGTNYSNTDPTPAVLHEISYTKFMRKETEIAKNHCIMSLNIKENNTLKH